MRRDAVKGSWMYLAVCLTRKWVRRAQGRRPRGTGSSATIDLRIRGQTLVWKTELWST